MRCSSCTAVDSERRLGSSCGFSNDVGGAVLGCLEEDRCLRAYERTSATPSSASSRLISSASAASAAKISSSSTAARAPDSSEARTSFPDRSRCPRWRRPLMSKWVPWGDRFSSSRAVRRFGTAICTLSVPVAYGIAPMRSMHMQGAAPVLRPHRPDERRSTSGTGGRRLSIFADSFRSRRRPPHESGGERPRLAGHARGRARACPRDTTSSGRRVENELDRRVDAIAAYTGAFRPARPRAFLYERGKGKRSAARALSVTRLEGC